MRPPTGAQRGSVNDCHKRAHKYHPLCREKQIANFNTRPRAEGGLALNKGPGESAIALP